MCPERATGVVATSCSVVNFLQYLNLVLPAVRMSRLLSRSNSVLIAHLISIEGCYASWALFRLHFLYLAVVLIPVFIDTVLPCKH